MTAPTIVRPTAPPQELSDADLEAAGMLTPDAMEFDSPGGSAMPALNVTDLDFDRAPKPGDQLFKWNQGNQPGFQAEAQGTDPTLVRIYRIDGKPVDMRRDWAILRLLKRYPKTHPSYPNQPVFYKRQPRVPVAPTMRCTATEGGGCTKTLFTQFQVDQHFASKHKGEWQRLEAQRARAQQERGIVAQENMAEMFRRFLDGGGNVAQLPTELKAAVVVEDEGPLPFEPIDNLDGFDVNTADKKALMKYASETGIAKAAGKNPMLVPIEELRDMARAHIALGPEY